MTTETIFVASATLVAGCIVASICADWLDEYLAWRHSNPHFGRIAHRLAVWAGRMNRKMKGSQHV